jgi:hypothetical protein
MANLHDLREDWNGVMGVIVVLPAPLSQTTRKGAITHEVVANKYRCNQVAGFVSFSLELGGSKQVYACPHGGDVDTTAPRPKANLGPGRRHGVPRGCCRLAQPSSWPFSFVCRGIGPCGSCKSHPHSGNCENCGNAVRTEFPHFLQIPQKERGLSFAGIFRVLRPARHKRARAHRTAFPHPTPPRRRAALRT